MMPDHLRLPGLLPLMAALLGGVPAASAQTCSVSATAAAFGLYSPTALPSDDTTASVVMSCQSSAPKLVSYSLALSVGSGTSYGARTLRSGANTLAYQIYSDPLHTTVWGDGTGGSGIVSGSMTSTSLSVSQGATAYGSIPARQNVAPGSYADHVMVTITY